MVGLTRPARLRPVLVGGGGLALAAVGWTGSRLAHRLTAFLHPRTRRPRSAMASLFPGVAVSDVQFSSVDGTALHASFIPAGAARRPAVIVLAGYGQGLEAVRPHAAYLHDAGYNVLVLDVRGTDGSAGTFTFGMKEPLDVSAAVSYLCASPEVDAAQIAVQGVSIGGAIAILAAARDPRISAVVAESAFPSLREMIVTNFRRYLGLPLFPLGHVVVWLMERLLGGRVEEVNPVAAIPLLSGRPILLIDAGADTVSPPGSGQRLAAAAGEPKTFWYVADARHAESFWVDPLAYQKRVLAFYSALGGDDSAPSREPMPESGPPVA